MTRPIENAKLHENCLIILFPLPIAAFGLSSFQPPLAESETGVVHSRRAFNQN
jgi:hypothetical protein